MEVAEAMSMMKFGARQTPQSEVIQRFKCMVCGKTEDISLGVFRSDMDVCFSNLPEKWDSWFDFPICPDHSLTGTRLVIDGKVVKMLPYADVPIEFGERL